MKEFHSLTCASELLGTKVVCEANSDWSVIEKEATLNKHRSCHAHM